MSLSANVDLIIHTAWPVSFNLELLAFHPQFAGIVNFLSLAASTTSTVHFEFIAPVAVVEGHTAVLASQEVRPDPSTPAPAPSSCARVEFLSELLTRRNSPKNHPPHWANCHISHKLRFVEFENTGSWSTVILGSIYVGRIPDNQGLRFDVVDFGLVICAFSGWLVYLWL
ncbi:uncharacterized protein EAE97_003491 [Botrytis byssoidea]|uniref:Thioester reductase (TE) domain-containing protein n=1 Tax=Botrytis byssoidea TaxID=139641 RepID=A0A9P5IN44_9HELO|nr:uncharacterized protein EAE97_003491 [Botrytis byssoidea]KAF7948080.1 hypothetical protein EAE97_003491 [Botrytis byssoidea]